VSISSPPPKEVCEALELLLESPDFDKSERSREFLRYVVSAKLENRECEISQHALAAAVFGRGERFDPNTDPIVRMQAGRVRRALEHYYLTHRDQVPVRIIIPKGTYVPEFVRNEEAPNADPDRDHAGSDTGDRSVPVIIVCPFANLTGNPELDYAAKGLSMHIAVEADKTQDARVFVSPFDPFDETNSISAGLPRGLSGDYCLRGALHSRGTELQMNRFDHTGLEVEVADFLYRGARHIAQQMFNEGGVLYRHEISSLPSAPDVSPGTHEAILRYFSWQAAPDHNEFGRVVSGLQNAVQNEPQNGMARSFLARCYADLWALGFEGVSVQIEDALDLSLDGVGLSPNDCRAQLIVGYVCLVMDDLEAASGHAKSALALAGGSPLFQDSIAYLITLCGDWENGPAMLREAIRENPFHHPYVHGPLWLDALRKQDYATAALEASATTMSSHFWTPLMRCVACAHLGRIDAAVRCRDEILQFRPGFVDRGDWLIRRYIKDDSLVARIKEGLAIAGLSVP
jgi:adenylate cyclase